VLLIRLSLSRGEAHIATSEGQSRSSCLLHLPFACLATRAEAIRLLQRHGPWFQQVSPTSGGRDLISPTDPGGVGNPSAALGFSCSQSRRDAVSLVPVKEVRALHCQAHETLRWPAGTFAEWFADYAGFPQLPVVADVPLGPYHALGRRTSR
jgi:hypothetical protein